MDLNKSINSNLILNFIRIGISLIFPLISFPYVSRVLLPEGMGIVNYSNSIVTYFALLSELGISTYAIRECSICRSNKDEFYTVSSELFSLNIVTALISYIILFLVIVFVPKLEAYQVAVVIYSSTIFFNAIGVEWVYLVYEDYFYITVRSVIFQTISLILIFVFVKTAADIYNYIFLAIFPSIASNILNFCFLIKRNQYIRFFITKKVFAHIIPSLIIFSTSLATTVYTTLDVSMLGWMAGDVAVGNYSAALKIYNVFKSVINSTSTVFLARIMFLINRDITKYREMFKYAFSVIAFLCIPVSFVLIFFSADIMLIIAGPNYSSAPHVLSIISASLFFSCLANLYATGALLAIRREKLVLFATVTGTILNVIMNLKLIPFYNSIGASVSTLITEFAICFLLFICFKRNFQFSLGITHFFKCFFSSLPILIVKVLCGDLIHGNIFVLIVILCLCIGVYILLLVLLKDSFMINICKSLILNTKKIRNKTN